MNAKSIIKELRTLGTDGYKKILLRHGANEPCLGVKIEELKKIQKRAGMVYDLALELYDSGIYDAMYLAGLMADDAKMTKADLNRWANQASEPLAGSTVPWVAAGNREGWEIALEWIESDKPLIAVAGWGTLSAIVSMTDDARLDTAELKRLLKRIEKEIHTAPDVVRYQMNGFVIAVGSYVPALTMLAKEMGERMGKLTVDMGETACQVPYAPDYIAKVEKRGSIGKKRKSVKC